jgi:hypothetical protein
MFPRRKQWESFCSRLLNPLRFSKSLIISNEQQQKQKEACAKLLKLLFVIFNFKWNLGVKYRSIAKRQTASKAAIRVL